MLTPDGPTATRLSPWTAHVWVPIGCAILGALVGIGGVAYGVREQGDAHRSEKSQAKRAVFVAFYQQASVVAQIQGNAETCSSIAKVVQYDLDHPEKGETTDGSPCPGNPLSVKGLTAEAQSLTKQSNALLPELDAAYTSFLGFASADEQSKAAQIMQNLNPDEYDVSLDDEWVESAIQDLWEMYCADFPGVCPTD